MHLLRREGKKHSAPMDTSWQVHEFIAIKIRQHKYLQNPGKKLSYTHTQIISNKNKSKALMEWVILSAGAKV